MTAVIRSEWLKLRSLRSTYLVLGIAALGAVLGCLVSLAMTLTWDMLPPAEQATMESADPHPVVYPFLTFCVATLAAITVTGEYGTGMIRTSLVAAPVRWRVLAAKSVVVGGVTVVVGEVLAVGMYLAYRWVVGDRGAPIGTSEGVLEALPPLLGTGVGMAGVCLVALGLGAAIRSTAGTVVALMVLLFMLPALGTLLPDGIVDGYQSLMLLNLGHELGGLAPQATLSPPGALAVLVGYVAVALGIGGAMLHRRDA